MLMAAAEPIQERRERGSPRRQVTDVGTMNTSHRKVKTTKVSQPDVKEDCFAGAGKMSNQNSKISCAGFVNNFVGAYQKGNPLEIMAYYGADYLPVPNTLAKQFVICDHWFCSVPGPTWPNRFFVNTGTSPGHVDMPSLAGFDPAWHNYTQPIIFERLSEANPK